MKKFNYFSVNEESKWSPKSEFYLVDLPGVGYAKVPKKLREQWSGFMQKYLTERPTLKVCVWSLFSFSLSLVFFSF
jgi:GTP-binding protein